MNGTIVRYADVQDAAWVNGSGTTRLMWSDAEGARRISIASLMRSAPFSLLPDMLRTMVVLDPLQVKLKIDDRTVKMKRGDTLTFRGGQCVTVVALDRPGRVLNVMGRMNSWEPHVSRDPASAMLTGWVVADAIVWNGNVLDRGDLVLGATPPSGMLAIAFRPIASSTTL